MPVLLHVQQIPLLLSHGVYKLEMSDDTMQAEVLRLNLIKVSSYRKKLLASSYKDMRIRPQTLS